MLLDELATYLAAQGLGLTVGTNLYKSDLPPTPDACVALLETGGLPAAHTMSGGAGSAVYERPTVQVICRAGAQDYATARATAQDVHDALDGLSDTDLSGVRYISIRAIQPPFELGLDERARPLVGLNVQIDKEPS